jgi:hypothetical protein
MTTSMASVFESVGAFTVLSTLLAVLFMVGVVRFMSLLVLVSLVVFVVVSLFWFFLLLVAFFLVSFLVVSALLVFAFFFVVMFVLVSVFLWIYMNFVIFFCGGLRSHSSPYVCLLRACHRRICVPCGIHPCWPSCGNQWSSIPSCGTSCVRAFLPSSSFQLHDVPCGILLRHIRISCGRPPLHHVLNVRPCGEILFLSSPMTSSSCDLHLLFCHAVEFVENPLRITPLFQFTQLTFLWCSSPYSDPPCSSNPDS